MDTAADSDHDRRRDSWAKHVNWWLLLLGPLAGVAAVVYSRIDPDAFQWLQVTLETPAPYLVAAAAAIYTVRLAVTRNPLFLLVAVLAVALSLREFHFDWTHRGIYIMLGGIGVWAFLWRKRLIGPLRDWRNTSWLLAAFATYFLSQLIARRVFRPIPGEHEIHRSLEECVETAAHVLFIVSGFVGSWRKAPTKPKRVE